MDVATAPSSWATEAISEASFEDAIADSGRGKDAGENVTLILMFGEASSLLMPIRYGLVTMGADRNPP
jgi:hypothetical protein